MKWRIPGKERNKALEWFGVNAEHFKFGGGSTQQFIFHAQQNAIERTFPNPAERFIRINDLQAALDVANAVKRSKNMSKPITKRVRAAQKVKEQLRKKRKKSSNAATGRSKRKRKKPIPSWTTMARRTTASIQNMYI